MADFCVNLETIAPAMALALIGRHYLFHPNFNRITQREEIEQCRFKEVACAERSNMKLMNY